MTRTPKKQLQEGKIDFGSWLQPRQSTEVGRVWYSRQEMEGRDRKESRRGGGENGSPTLQPFSCPPTSSRPVVCGLLLPKFRASLPLAKSLWRHLDRCTEGKLSYLPGCFSSQHVDALDPSGQKEGGVEAIASSPPNCT